MECNFKHYIRPGVFITLLTVFIIMIFLDNLVLNIKQAYIDAVQAILMTMVIFYFGGRTYEKVKNAEE